MSRVKKAVLFIFVAGALTLISLNAYATGSAKIGGSLSVSHSLIFGLLVSKAGL